MQENFEIKANFREANGTNASRRLRRSGKVPGIIYGAGKQPQMITVEQNELIWHLDHEAFYSRILTLDLDGKRSDQVVLKDLQRHPANSVPMHIDLLRIKQGQAIRMTTPLHVIGKEDAPGITKEKGALNQQMTELEIDCLPKDLPEFIEIDISGMNIGDVVSLSRLKLPEGVTAVMLIGTEERGEEALAEFDPVVVTILPPALEEEIEEEVEASAVPTLGGGEEGEPEKSDAGRGGTESES